MDLMFNRLKAVSSRTRDAFRQAQAQLAQAAGYGLMNHHTFTDYAERSLLLQGRLAARTNPVGRRIADLSEAEFCVFSQWGEDGIIEWLVAHVDTPNARFVEFGVETFREANCRFLMQNRNWKGLVLDGSEANMAALRTQPLFWRHHLEARAAFVTAENINKLISEAGFAGALGILSIDIDGNDYWIWNAIDCLNPAIVICEYNPIFGDMRAVTIPYDPEFQRLKAHYSGLYFGASIAALRHLARQKGYSFVGTNSNGINAFFVKSDLAATVLELLGAARAHPSRHRDSRDAAGQLTFTGGPDRLTLIGDMRVVDVESGCEILLKEIVQPYSDDWARRMA